MVTLVLCTNIKKENQFTKGKSGIGEGKKGNKGIGRKSLVDFLLSISCGYNVIYIMTKLPLSLQSR